MKKLPCNPRISSLPGLFKCPGFASLRADADRDHSKAANTGTAAGRIAELCHRGYFFEDACQQAMAESHAEFPMADMGEAIKHVRGYVDDPRNANAVGDGDGVIGDYCELEVVLDVPPVPGDPHGPIRLVGHVDVVKRVNGQLEVWDLKNGKPSGRDMLYSYAPQLAAYALACTETLGEPVLPGGVVRLRGYSWSTRCKWDRDDMSTAPAYFHAGWSLDTCRDILATVAQQVALLRDGRVMTTPGPHCNYCPGRGPGECHELISTTFGGSNQ